jgi:hypothetical protein
MKAVRVASVAALILASAAMSSLAQDTANPSGGAFQTRAVQQKSGTGTESDGTRSTGWTGSNRSQGTRGTSGESSNHVSDSADGQPLMATGADLQGPPRRFPANQTPE